MRIAIITESFLPNVNGVTNSILRLLEFCDAYGHEAMVIAPESGAPIDSYLGFKVKYVPSVNIKKIIPIGIPNFSIRHFLEGFNPEIIHLASPTILGAYMINVGQELGIPTLSMYQTDLSGFARHYGLTLGNLTLQKRIARIHENSNRTLVPSRSAASDLKKYGVSNVFVLPRGVDLQLFSPIRRDEALRNVWRNGRPKYLVGYMGRIANEKSIEDLSVLNDDNRIQLVIIGDGPARERIKRILPNAIFQGHLSGEDLATKIASLDIFVHTGRHETFCQSLQEALASGIPAVAPASGGPLDLIQHGFNGQFFTPGHNREMKKAVYSILEGDLESYEFAARESVISRDWDSINKRLFNHYHELINTRKIRRERTVGA